jgi:hypothetical protein
VPWKRCQNLTNALRLSETKNQTGGSARLILRAGVEAGYQVIELNGAKREEGRDMEINAGAQSGRESSVTR